MTENRPAAVTIIAEAGVNHNGSLDMALRLVDAAADAGADMVKFQTFKAEKLVTRATPKAAYQVRNTGSDDGQLKMLRRLELDEAAHHRLVEHCVARGIGFLSTPFDDESTDFLVGRLGVDTLKVGSGDMTNGPHLLRLAAIGTDIILSTGMATLSEVEEALGVLAHGLLGRDAPGSAAFSAAFEDPEGKRLLAEKVTLLHCTSNYPAPADEINLAVIDLYEKVFPCVVGFSDHSDGIAIPIAAVARGARMIEKHLTLDRALPGPDHVASIEPMAFAEMVRGIREVTAAIGVGVKVPTAGERNTMVVARKSLVAARPIAVGEIFDRDSVVIKRPGNGMAPNRIWDIVGRRATRSYAPDDLVAEELEPSLSRKSEASDR